MKQTYKKPKYVHPNILAFFPSKPAKDINIWDNLRKVAKGYPLEVQKKLEWMIFYETIAKRNASYTSEYFNISRKTFHKWHTKFIKSKKRLESLKNSSRAPIHTRKWEVTHTQEDRIYNLRKKHMKYGKRKLQALYEKEYGEYISTWKIERIIRKHRLYPDKAKNNRITAKRAKGRKNPKIKIHSVKDISKYYPLWHIDCIILNIDNLRRVIVTALEDSTRMAYAKMYKSNTSKNTEDFVKRLMYLSGNNIKTVHTDNGSEFDGFFAKTVRDLKIQRLYSRPYTPKDNGKNERFNRSLQYEWLDDYIVNPNDLEETNKALTKWLIEYNQGRPHASLDYLTPLEYFESNLNVLPMCPAHTKPFSFSVKV